jgi:signal transduction histidine kinase
MIRARRRPAPDTALKRFTSRLGPPVPAAELLLQVAEALRASLGASRAEVWTTDGAQLVRTVSVPHIGEGDAVDVGPREREQLRKPDVYSAAWARVWLPGLLEGRPECSLRIAPVVNDGETLGVLVVESDDDFTTADATVLSELARHLGLSLHNERLRLELEATLADVRRANEELRASRARIVAAADAERRRIERDLHDGAQQQLIALSIDLRRARDVVETDPEAAASRMDHATQAAAAAIEDLANLAHGIYPPILRDSGLVAALRVIARRHRSPIELDIPRFDRPPPEVEAAVYFAILEAVQNAAKHAPDALVSIRIAVRGGMLDFEVADDGPGFDPDAASRGHGMFNLSDRLGALGGTVGWDTAPGAGTRVRGTVPIA